MTTRTSWASMTSSMASSSNAPRGRVAVEKPGSVSESFGCHTFTLEEMRKRLARPIFEAIQATIGSGDALDMGLADEIAHAMKEWAIENGATHFTCTCAIPLFCKGC